MGDWLIQNKEPENFQAAAIEKSEPNDLVLPKSRIKNYVILDAAIWGTNMDIAFDLCPTYISLFATRGAEHNLDSVAPYLFTYEEGNEFDKWLKTQEQKGLRALYISSYETLEGLRKHLRRFLRMKREDGSFLYFRFYDPFVAITVLPNLSSAQCSEFFAKIDSLIADDMRIKTRHIFCLSNENKLLVKHQSL